MESEQLTFDVSDSFPGSASIAGTYFAPNGSASDRPLLVCIPGGTYNCSYWDLDVPGHTDYSFARCAADEGFPVLTLDTLGTGESSRPDDEVDLAAMAEALESVLIQLPSVIHVDRPAVAVSHSMGGYVSLTQQDRHESYAGLVVLGTTNFAVALLELPDELIAAASTAEARDTIVEQTASAMDTAYIDGDHAAQRSWFHLDDVPLEVVQADNDSMTTVVPRRSAAQSSTPGITIDAARRVRVPILVGYGEVDISPDPRADASIYVSSPDVTLYLLAGSAHCHNTATTRHDIWERLFGWCLSAVSS